jgi:hypothetical protein
MRLFLISKLDIKPAVIIQFSFLCLLIQKRKKCRRKKSALFSDALRERVAERTGLEPATPGVTGRYSNHLNYRSKTVIKLVGVEGLEPPTFAL